MYLPGEEAVQGMTHSQTMARRQHPLPEIQYFQVEPGGLAATRSEQRSLWRLMDLGWARGCWGLIFEKGYAFRGR